MDVNDLSGYAQVFEVLVSIGLATVDQVKEFFTKAGADETTLNAILMSVEARLARRTDPNA